MREVELKYEVQVIGWNAAGPITFTNEPRYDERGEAEHAVSLLERAAWRYGYTVVCNINEVEIPPTNQEEV